MHEKYRFDINFLAKRVMGILLLTIAGTVHATIAQESSKKSVEALALSAVKHFNAFEYEPAIRDCTEAIRLAPNNEQLYSFRGAIYVQIMEYGKALSDFDEALRLNPNAQGPIESLRGIALFNLKRWDDAIKSLTLQLRSDQKDFRAYTLRGNAYVEKKELKMAMDDFARAIQLNAQESRAYMCRANARILMGEYASAVSDASEEIQLNPKLADAYTTRARAYRGLGKIELAETDEKTASELKVKVK